MKQILITLHIDFGRNVPPCRLAQWWHGIRHSFFIHSLAARWAYDNAILAFAIHPSPLDHNARLCLARKSASADYASSYFSSAPEKNTPCAHCRMAKRRLRRALGKRFADCWSSVNTIIFRHTSAHSYLRTAGVCICVAGVQRQQIIIQTTTHTKNATVATTMPAASPSFYIFRNTYSVMIRSSWSDDRTTELDLEGSTSN